MVGAPRETPSANLQPTTRGEKEKGHEKDGEPFVNMHLRNSKLQMPHAKNRQLLQQYKTKIIRIHSSRHRTVMLDMNEPDTLEGEEITLYELLKIQVRKE
jgi:hypothetical protein